jgi:hypothetical protein
MILHEFRQEFFGLRGACRRTGAFAFLDLFLLVGLKADQAFV